LRICQRARRRQSRGEIRKIESMKSNLSHKEVPKGWRVALFGEVASLRKGLTYKSSDYSDEKSGMVFLTLKSILRGGGFNKDGVKYYKGEYEETAVLKPGDLIIANTDITRNAEVVGAPVFVPTLSEKPVLMSMDLSAIDVDEQKVSKLFLYHLLRGENARAFMKSQANGSTVLHLKTSNVPKFEFKLPSLLEQKKIAEILSSVDEEIQKIDSVISGSEKLRNGLVQDLFTKGIGHKKFKETKIGFIPENWSVLPIKESNVSIIDGDRGINYPKSNEFSSEGYCLFLSTKNIKDDQFTFNGSQFVSREKDGMLRKGKLQRGDVVLTTRGTVGNVAFYDELVPFDNIRINSGMVLIRAGGDFIPSYVYHLFKSSLLKKRYSELASGSAQPQLPIRSLENILMPIPSLGEQKRIIEISESIDKKILISKNLGRKLVELKKGLMSDLLSGKVRIVKI
jgi:type I restriction enzyme S subunit